MRPAGRLHPIGSRPAGEPVSSDANGTRNRPPARVAGKRFSLRVSSRFASVYDRQAAPAGLVMITVMTASRRLRYLSCGGSLRLQLEPPGHIRPIFGGYYGDPVSGRGAGEQFRSSLFQGGHLGPQAVQFAIYLRKRRLRLSFPQAVAPT